MSNLTATAILAAYVVGGFGTFGHVFNENFIPPKAPTDCGIKPDILKDSDGNRKWFDCRYQQIDDRMSDVGSAAPPAILAGLFWPAYWAGHVAIKVTR